jgi:DNA (cytosine-5)-methyltransferase 1
MDKTVAELFAGVGGFRVGLNDIREIDKEGKAVENGPFRFVYADQWEPDEARQSAYNCYIKRFGSEGVSNEDITEVDKATLPDHTLLVGGFPCQDYSVARCLYRKDEKGIEGKKGVLWWQINEILWAKKPPFVLLENVDRLLISPADQRGKNFGIILKCFCDAGYGVQWRVINAADYGHPQRRRRTFIFAFRKDTKYFKNFVRTGFDFEKNMIFSSGFPAHVEDDRGYLISSCQMQIRDFVRFSDTFSFGFENAGYCLDGFTETMRLFPDFSGEKKTLEDVLLKDQKQMPASVYDFDVEKIKYMKSAKTTTKTNKKGIHYQYSEGLYPFPDNLDKPSRTMITKEATTNRCSHVIVDPVTKHYRFLAPIECERLDGFPEGWTATMSDRRRYFCLGNALVTGVVKTLGDAIGKVIDGENQ